MEHPNSKKEGFVILREFKAPKELVFEAFSKPEAIAEWWGPVGMPATVKKMEFKIDGKMHYKIEGNGQVMWGLFIYKNISRPDLIEFISAFSDENENICKSPFPIDFPMQIFNQLTLTESSGITTLKFTGHPFDATPEQETTYYSMFDSMNQGWTGTLNQLETYLTKTTKRI